MNNFLKNFIEEKYGKNIAVALDFGSGNGKDVQSLKNIGWKIEGLDLPKYDLNLPYQNEHKVDLIYSIAVLPFIKNKKIFVKNVLNNLKRDGWFFLLTFDKKDQVLGRDRGVSKKELLGLFKNFKNISIRTEDFFDKEDGHNHWHKLLILTLQKK